MEDTWSAAAPIGVNRGVTLFLNDSLKNSQIISYPRYATIFASVCAILFIIIGILGNLVTALALICCPRLRTHATTAFVLSLCVSDLIFCSLNLPLTAARYIHEAWTLGEVLCQLFPVLFYGNVTVSVLSMVAITINRFIMIACHGNYTRIYSPLSIWLQLIFIWGVSFAMMLPPLMGVWGRLGLDVATFSCTILPLNGRSPKKTYFLAGFALPCLVIVISYSCIYYLVTKSRKRLDNHRQYSREPKSRSSSNREREDSRLTFLMLTIFVAFLLCFLPLTLVNVFDDDTTLPTLHVVASVMAWASSVINPFIYAASNRQYRSAYKNLLDRLLKRNTGIRSSSQQPPTSNNNANISAPSHSTPLSGKSGAQPSAKLHNIIKNIQHP